MTERLNTLEAKVRSCLYCPVWPKFPGAAGENMPSWQAWRDQVHLPLSMAVALPQK